MDMTPKTAGGEPEQVFIHDPALDRAVAMIMMLAAELYVVKDRLRAMEVILQERGALDEGALDHYEPSAAERDRMDAERKAYVGGLMQCVLGEQASKGAPADLLQRFG
jgi:hypothetical protein